MTTTEYKPNAKDVQQLRQRTGAGMMDCRNALASAGGDMNLAVENLRKSGIAKAEKARRPRGVRRPYRGEHGAWTRSRARSSISIPRRTSSPAMRRLLPWRTPSARPCLPTRPSMALSPMPPAARSVDPARGQDGRGQGDRDLCQDRGERRAAPVCPAHDRRDVRHVYSPQRPRGGDRGSGPAHGRPAKELARTVAEHVAAGVPRVPEAVRREDVTTELVERERRIFTRRRWPKASRRTSSTRSWRVRSASSSRK